MFIYFREREGEFVHEQGREKGRERDRKNEGGTKGEGDRERIPSRLHTVSTEPMRGLIS